MFEEKLDLIRILSFYILRNEVLDLRTTVQQMREIGSFRRPSLRLPLDITGLIALSVFVFLHESTVPLFLACLELMQSAISIAK